MKKLYIGLVGITVAYAMVLQANAADFSPTPGGYKDIPSAAVTWSGLYGGVNLGYGWSTQSDQLACDTTCESTAGAGATFGGVSPEGWLWGIQAGYNFQGFGFPWLVVGIETDVSASTVYGQGSDGAGDFFHSRLEALGTVRGRAGYAFDCALVYFTGGLAWGTMLNEASLAGALSSGNDYYTNPTVTGYVLGGGVEYKFWRDLSVKVEYQYVNLGKNNPVDIANSTGTYTANGGTVRDDAFNTVRVGLNWWPFWAPEPLK